MKNYLLRHYIEGLLVGDSTVRPPSVPKLFDRVQEEVSSLSRKNQELADSLKELAVAQNTDQMTGLFNKSAGTKGIINLLGYGHNYNEETETGDRKSLALIVFDIDKFKSVNDTYGHFVGDEVIKAVAHQATETFKRRTDLISRYDNDDATHNVVARDGGEEFVVAFLCDADKAGETARNMAEALRTAVATNCYILETEDKAETDISKRYKIGPKDMSGFRALRPVTISAGVAFIDPEFMGNPDIITNIKYRADLALYESKGGGRDRVTVYNDSKSSVFDAPQGPISSQAQSSISAHNL